MLSEVYGAGQDTDADISEIDQSILELIRQGAKNSEIADRLHYSLASVKVRVRRLMQAFGARNRAELAAKASRPARTIVKLRGGYRVTLIGELPPLAAAFHGAQFQVAADAASARVAVRLDPSLPLSIGLHRQPGLARLVMLALVRRLRRYLEEGIDIDSPYHEVNIDTRQELEALLRPEQCDFLDASSSRCLVASVLDPAGGAADADLCLTCNVPPAEIRCDNLSAVATEGIMASPDIQTGRFVSAARCLKGQHLPPACVDSCIPGWRGCWSKTIAPAAP